MTVPADGAGTSIITIDGTSPGRVFDGVGALSAGASSRLLVDYPEPERGQILDYLFTPGHGAALQVLKVEIGGDTNSTDGTEPSHMRGPGDLNCDRGYEWWLMEQAKQRNPNVTLSALAWGTPGWVGGGQQTVWTDRFTSYLLSWLGCAARHGLRIDYLGGWNEKGFNAAWYEKLRAALVRNGYGYIKIVADDSFNWSVAGALATDPAFAAAVDVVGQHYVCGYLTAYTSCPSPSTAQQLNKPLWASEQGSQPYDTGAAPLARALNRQYIDGRITGAVNWSLEWSAYQGLPFAGDGLLLANEPWSGHYTVGPSVWATAHTTQFTQPGWRYLDSGSTRIPGGSVVSLRSPVSADWSSIAETLDATTPQQVTFSIAGGLSTGAVHVWSSTMDSARPSDWFVRQPDIRPNHGAFTVTLQPGRVYSFTTTNGQGRGAAASPPASAWRLPYVDDFGRYPTDATPRYFSDLGGTFATAPCTGRPGMCLRSAVDQQPVQWNNLDNHPLTVIGDPTNWHDYDVGVDARLDQAGSVDLGARVVNGVSGYHLTAGSDGHWTLTRVAPDGAVSTLASGSTDFPVGAWHHVSLRVRQIEVTAAVDGRPLATVGDDVDTAGQVSLGVSNYQHAEFANLTVTPDLGVATRLSVANISPSPVYLAAPGDQTVVSAQVSNPGPVPATAITLAPRVPSGWTVVQVQSGPTTLAPGQTGTWRWRIGSPSDVMPDSYPGAVTLNYRSGGQVGAGARDLPLYVGMVPQSAMTATADSAQEPGYEAKSAIDGDRTTMWHSAWSPYQPPPHELTQDLGGGYQVTGLRYVPRQDGNPNGIVTSYAVEVSMDGTTFTPVATGSWAADDSTKSAVFPARAARYVRLRALAGVNGYTAAAEINVFGKPSHGER
ncbi:discoidin domain-containing protein [Kutzneria chonburiensis]|uniref:galactosylceramidase n=1 Tax=Kutzneria chonburiensis TaxID=1483604 RepID=A0ABV6MIZ3_9PSEU|nr:discoidin domain-containing protein [Kutzneria chonburiensis]